MNKLSTIQTEAEADEILSDMVKKFLAEKPEYSYEKAEEEVKMFIGYYSAYFDNETRRRICTLFNTCHPFLGPGIETMTDIEIIEVGKRIGEACKAGGGDALKDLIIKPPVKVERKIQL